MDDDLINDKLELAKLYFKSKKYHKALPIYHLLIKLLQSLTVAEIISARVSYNLPDSNKPYIGKLHHPKLITALDSRAATYEKLGDIESSMSDSNTILFMNPVELKGYLRLGKLLLKLNDLSGAYRNYQVGAYTIEKFILKYPDYPMSDSLYESFKHNYQHVRSLKRSHQSLQTLISLQFKPKKQRKSMDPFLYLNQDILYVIFDLLSLKQILSCHLVCKSWYSNLRLMIYLYLDKLELKSRIKYKEFLNGVKLFSKVKANLINLRVNKTANGEFIRIFDSIVKSNFKLRVFENYNLMQFNELILRVDKLKFKCNFRHLNTLKLVLNSNPSVELLNIFPNLHTMELIIMSNQDQANMKLLTQLVNKQAYKKLTIPNDLYEKLHSMVLISNSAVNNSLPYINLTFNLTKLILANFDFNNVQHIFGRFLSNCQNLKTLLLENNKNLTLKDFFNNLVNYKSNFRLKNLTFREYLISSSCNLQEFQPSDFHNLQDIETLDLYCCSLSNNGLLKLLKHCTYISTLVLGSSNYIYFKNESISTRFVRLNLHEVLVQLPLLKNLSLIDLNLDNLSLSYFEKDFKRLNIHLDSIDLSFNLNINGIGLLSFLSSRWAARIAIDGVYINPDTVRLIESRGTQMKNDHMKTRWRQYGVNSFILNN